MPYKISGNAAQQTRVLVLEESDYSLVGNTLATGAYEIGSLATSNTKLVLGRNDDGEVANYRGVTPIYYDNTPIPTVTDLNSGVNNGWINLPPDDDVVYDFEYNRLGTGTTSFTGFNWLRFAPNIPQGSTITSAYVRWRWWGTTSRSGYTTVRIENSANATLFTSSNDYDNRSWYNMGNASWGAGTVTEGVYYNTVSMVTGVQAVVNKAAWAPGNYLQVGLGPSVARYLFLFDSYKTVGGVPPKLHITYIAP